MADSINLDAVHAGIKATKLLRAAVRDLYKTLCEGPNIPYVNDSNDDVQDKVLSELQLAISQINNRVRDLESACTMLSSSQNTSISLGNSGLLAQDPAWERSPLYSSLISSYRWSDRVSEQAAYAYTNLSQNSLKRSFNQGFSGLRHNRSILPRRPVYLPAQYENLVINLRRMLPDMHIDIILPFGSPTYLRITLDRVLKAVVVLRSAYIEWVMVKAFTEDFDKEDGTVDIWTESRYEVFRKITDHANAAMLHFVHNTHPDVAVRSFMVCNDLICYLMNYLLSYLYAFFIFLFSFYLLRDLLSR